jgi:hypothetical protein
MGTMLGVAFGVATYFDPSAPDRQAPPDRQAVNRQKSLWFRSLAKQAIAIVAPRLRDRNSASRRGFRARPSHPARPARWLDPGVLTMSEMRIALCAA